jgi:hypothetical protein
MTSELAQLPASVWKEVAAALMRSPGFAQQIADVLIDALSAEGVHFVKGDGPGSGWQKHSDFRTRLDAVKLILAYAEGMPLQRIFEHKISETRGNLADVLRESPETLEAVEREIAKAKFRHRHDVKQVVEIEPP